MSVQPYYQNKNTKGLSKFLLLIFVLFIALPIVWLVRSIGSSDAESEFFSVPIVEIDDTKDVVDNLVVDNVEMLSMEEGNTKNSETDYYAYTWDCGTTYEGEWKNNQIHGYGTILFYNMEYYEGEFINGLRHGHGIYIWPCGTKYVGEWAFDEQNGQGQIIYDNGEQYIGEFKNGYKHGKGEYINLNGEVVKGEWKDDQLLSSF